MSSERKDREFVSKVHEWRNKDDKVASITETLKKTIQAYQAILNDEDCDWHHEDIEAAKTIAGLSKD